MKHFVRDDKNEKTSPCASFGISPQQVGRPDDGQVLAVHVGDTAKGRQAGKMPHKKLQGPKTKGASIRTGCCCSINNNDTTTLFSPSGLKPQRKINNKSEFTKLRKFNLIHHKCNCLL